MLNVNQLIILLNVHRGTEKEMDKLGQHFKDLALLENLELVKREHLHLLEWSLTEKGRCFVGFLLRAEVKTVTKYEIYVVPDQKD